MCFDQEKTQAPMDPRHHSDLERAEKQMREKVQFHSELAGAVPRAARPMSDAEILRELFSYHPPTGETLPKFSAINQAAKNFAEVVLQNCPASHDRSAAINCIRMARMTANAAVALNGLSL